LSYQVTRQIPFMKYGVTIPDQEYNGDGLRFTLFRNGYNILKSFHTRGYHLGLALSRVERNVKV